MFVTSIQIYDALKAYGKQIRISGMLRRKKVTIRVPIEGQDTPEDEKQQDVTP